jgi:hypothetical protein
MHVHALYTKYFQKSKVFIYPLLGIKKGISVVPRETYLSWGTFYKPEDKKLICMYYKRTDSEYLKFEKEVLLKHNRLCDYIETDNESAVFIFNFSDLEVDWNYLIDGKYSQISKKTKETILNFFDKTSGNYIYMYSYLYPEKFFSRYAELLGVEEDLIKSVGELCTKPDLEKEMLMIEVPDLENLKIIS